MPSCRKHSPTPSNPSFAQHLCHVSFSFPYDYRCLLFSSTLFVLCPMLRPDLHRTWSYLPRHPLRITEQNSTPIKKNGSDILKSAISQTPTANRDPGTPPWVHISGPQFPLTCSEIPAFWLVRRRSAWSVPFQQRMNTPAFQPLSTAKDAHLYSF